MSGRALDTYYLAGGHGREVLELGKRAGSLQIQETQWV